MGDLSARRRKSSAVSRMPSIRETVSHVGSDQQPMQTVSPVGQEHVEEVVSGEHDVPPAPPVTTSQVLPLDPSTEAGSEGNHGGAWWSLSLDWLGSYICTWNKRELTNLEKMQLTIQNMRIEDGLQFEK